MTTVHIDFHQMALRALLKGTDGEVARDLRRRGQAVARRAKELCPKASGTLAASITVSPTHLGDDDELEVTIEANTDYSIFVEKGTRYMSARPFLGPALDEART